MTDDVFCVKRKPPIKRDDRGDLSDMGQVQGPGNFGFSEDFATCGIIIPRALVGA